MFETTPRLSTAKAMLAPSADQHGTNVLGEFFVTFLTLLPSASATNTWSGCRVLPISRLVLTKATLLPSGDHAEDVAPIVVNLMTFEPSAPITYISRLPLRLLVKKILPSVDQLGDISIAVS